MPPKKVSKHKKQPKSAAMEKAQLAMALYKSLKLEDVPKETVHDDDMIFLDQNHSKKGVKKAVHRPVLLMADNALRLKMWTDHLNLIVSQSCPKA